MTLRVAVLLCAASLTPLCADPLSFEGLSGMVRYYDSELNLTSATFIDASTLNLTNFASMFDIAATQDSQGNDTFRVELTQTFVSNGEWLEFRFWEPAPDPGQPRHCLDPVFELLNIPYLQAPAPGSSCGKDTGTNLYYAGVASAFQPGIQYLADTFYTIRPDTGITVVPEPQAVAILSGFLALLGWCKRKNQRRAVLGVSAAMVE